jgi:hypothetical protein
LCRNNLEKLTKRVSWGSVFWMYTYGEMRTYCTTGIMSLVFLLVIASANIAASQIYQWVDENGVSHFSQQPPAKDTQNVGTKTIRDTAPNAGGEAEDIYDTKAHEERMAEWREQREQERKDARDRKEKEATQQVRYPQPESYGRRPYIYPPIHRPPGRPPHNPDRPIFNPRPPTASLSRGD